MKPTLILARYVVPVRPQGAVLEDHGVLVERGRIQAILPAPEALELYPDTEMVRLPHHVLMPGMVNTHCHSAMTLLRGYADDLALQTWLNDHIWPAESRFVDSEFVADGTRLAIAEMIRCGTTSFIDQYFFPDVIARVVAETGIRASIGLPLIDFPTPWAGHFEEGLERGLEVSRQNSDHPLMSFSLAPHSPYSVSDAGLERVAETSVATGMRVDLHCLETAYDVEHSQASYGMRPLQRLDGIGLLNSRLLAIHMTQLIDGDYEHLAQKGVHIAHCPQSNLKLASGICPVTELVRAGVNVTVGTDGAASNNNLDILEEVRFAAMLAKGASGDPTSVDAIQALDMVTINGAKAMGLDAEIGSIEMGKQADLCAINLEAVQTRPLHNIFSQLIYAASSTQVSDVWVAGQALMENGTLTTISETELLGVADHWQARLNEHC